MPDLSPSQKRWRWLFLLLWLALIFVLSHQDKVESGQTSGLILSLLTWLGLSPEQIEAYELGFWVRKLAHMTEYFILYLLLFRVLTLYISGWRLFWLTWLGCVLYAVSDEWHQSFIPGRGGTPVDVCIDAGGALLAMGLMWMRAGKSAGKT